MGSLILLIQVYQHTTMDPLTIVWGIVCFIIMIGSMYHLYYQFRSVGCCCCWRLPDTPPGQAPGGPPTGKYLGQGLGSAGNQYDRTPNARNFYRKFSGVDVDAKAIEADIEKHDLR